MGSKTSFIQQLPLDDAHTMFRASIAGTTDHRTVAQSALLNTLRVKKAAFNCRRAAWRRFGLSRVGRAQR